LGAEVNAADGEMNGWQDLLSYPEHVAFSAGDAWTFSDANAALGAFAAIRDRLPQLFQDHETPKKYEWTCLVLKLRAEYDGIEAIAHSIRVTLG
jgi:hypothetical protein